MKPKRKICGGTIYSTYFQHVEAQSEACHIAAAQVHLSMSSVFRFHQGQWLCALDSNTADNTSHTGSKQLGITFTTSYGIWRVERDTRIQLEINSSITYSTLYSNKMRHCPFSEWIKLSVKGFTGSFSNHNYTKYVLSDSQSEVLQWH